MNAPTIEATLRDAENMIGQFAAVTCASGMLAAFARGPEHAHDHDAPFREGFEHVGDVAAYLDGLASRMEANES